MATLSSIGELGWIHRLSKKFPKGRGVRVGIGDDAAVLSLEKGKLSLLACDMLVDRVHFRASRLPATAIGWKALACVISDIAAMGGKPHWATVSLGVPRRTSLRWLDAFASGLNKCSQRFETAIVGGDTVRAERITVDVTVLGSVKSTQLTLRSGARPGDVLFVTGRLGGSSVGERHARFVPRLREAQELLKRVKIHAMMDVSDGLASDLWQLARASRVHLQVDTERIPVSQDARSVKQAFCDGEDYELLFAVSSRQAARVPSRIGAVPITWIGSVVNRRLGVSVRAGNGKVSVLKASGYSHF